uniref:poly [ADP-ribose] polymerase 14-like isoform X2 n=1 Tax=Ciona intestinalis TaxID=7719 RepID=UPI000180D214|nr:poly [ADP-ribose] polymerase 14-like isoform X2 [Ciona intestinalis]|eukprot:XP_002125672.1 poly [ADP-ribose] polymerase 14-like isoform X2 [Ciona intestinalis]
MPRKLVTSGLPEGCNLFKFKLWLKNNAKVNFIGEPSRENNNVVFKVDDDTEWRRLQNKEFTFNFAGNQHQIIFTDPNIQGAQQRSLRLSSIPSSFRNYPSLRQHLSRYGKVKKIHLDRSEQNPHAVVTFETPEEANRAKSAKLTVNDEVIHVEWDPNEAFKLNLAIPQSTTMSECGGLAAIPAGKRCLLVTSTDKAIPQDIVELYYGNETVTGGGEIVRILQQADGFLIEYKSEEYVGRVLERGQHHTLEKFHTHAFERCVPPYYEDRIKLSGLSPTTPFKTVQILLANYSREVGENVEVMCSQIVWYNKECVAIYTEEIDVYGLLEATEGKIYKGQELKAELLKRTHCLEVNGPKDCNDDLALYFDNKMETGGENVTRVQSISDGTAIIHFAKFSVAERVVHFIKGKQPPLCINGTPITVRLCYHELNVPIPAKAEVPQESQPAAPQLHNYSYRFNGHPDILHFIGGSDEIDLLNQKLGHAENVELNLEDGRIVATPKQNLDMNQTDFDATCEEIIQEFLNLFKHEQTEIDSTKLEFFKSVMNWGDISLPGVFRWYLGNKEAAIHLRHSSAAVEIVSRSDNVGKIIEVIKSLKGKLTQDTIEFSVKDCRKFNECGCYNKMCEKYRGVLAFDFDERKLTLKGNESTVVSAKVDVSTMIRAIVKHGVKIGKNETQCLKNALCNEKSAIREKIQECFCKARILASLQLATVPILYCSSDFDVANYELDQLISSDVMVLDTTSSAELLGTPAWTTLIDSMQNGLVQVWISPSEGNSLVFCGFKTELNKAKDLVTKFINENEKLSRTVQCSYRAASFFKMLDPQSKSALPWVKWELTFKNGGGIEITGTRKELNKAAHWIQNRIKSYKVPKAHDVYDAGFSEFFRSSKGEASIKDIGKRNECLILLDHEHFGYYDPNVQTVSPIKSVSLKDGNTTINVYKSNMSIHRCDAVVIPISPGMDLPPDGVSNAVAKRGGETFEKELNLKKEELNSKVAVGQVVTIPTSSHSVFKHCILAALPARWHDEQTPGKLLESCIKNALEAANKYKATSVAFPALCCGKCGGDIDECVSILVRSCKAFFMQHKTSRVNQVDLVELSNEKVLKAFEAELSKDEKPTMKKVPKVDKSNAKANKLKINLVIGSITKQRADVMINSTDPGSVHEVGKSRLAAAIREDAGIGLLNECKTLPQNEKLLGNVLVTKGHNLHCQHVYHVLISKWDFNDEAASTALIKKVVRKALQLATQNNCTSIALPAIGCGAFGFPAEQVAKYMKQEFDNVQGKTTLRSIYINLHPSDVKIIQKFRNVFANDIKVGNSNSRNLQIEIVKGKIENQKCDVFVNSVSDTMDLKGSGALSNSILNGGGDVVLQQFNDMKRKYASSTIRVTDGGNLPCDVVIHGATSKLGIQQFVTESLQIADELGKSTIALPALATGKLGGNPTACAINMKKAIIAFRQYNPQHVNSVKVVVYEGRMLREFKHVFVEDGNSSVGTLTLGSVCLEVYEGDVTKETGDVLVNNVAQNQQLEQAGPLSKSIVNAAGSSIVTEFNTQGTKSMKVTSGGNLSYDMIVHVGCGPNATQDVNNIVIEALQRAEAMNKSTVVLPAIGTGTRDNVPKCAKKMRDGIDSFIKQNPVSVKSIKVVVFDSGMLLHFQKALLEKRQGLMRWLYKAAKGKVMGDNKESSVDPELTDHVTFYFCALDDSKIHQTKADLRTIIKEESRSETIQDEIIAQLDEWYIKKIKSQDGVKVKIISRSSEISIEGLNLKVVEAVGECKHLLSEFKRAKSNAAEVQWYYKEQDDDDEVKPFSMAINLEIDTLFKTVGSEEQCEQISVDGVDIVVNFSSETALLDGLLVDIYRCDKSKGYPDVWKPMKRNEKLLTVDVDPWSDEFKKVLKEFKQSSSFIKSVVKLQRLQHPFQYDQFHSREKDVETELKSRNKTHLPVTRRLFHGTSPESCEKICKEGFNRSYAGKNATKYGKGMYFAVNSSYCHDNGFAQQGAGNCHMFLADVVTGEFGQGSPNSIVPPSTSSGNKESCHSAVDNTTNPSMFIVFRDYCVYPHYLLSYQK